MKKISVMMTLLLLWSGGLFAQEAITSAGGNAGGTGGTVSYTLGQVAYSSLTGSGGKENQGVQQPYEFFVTGIAGNKNISLELSVYPNPTRALIHLKIDKTLSNEHLVYLLYDLKGTLLRQQNIVAELTEIPMSDLAAANYLLRVTNYNNEEIQTFKIIKN